jgi:hypothetical protein
MGIIEDKIKVEILQNVFNDTIKIYDYLDNRFEFDNEIRDKIVALLHEFNNNLVDILKNVKLS